MHLETDFILPLQAPWRITRIGQGLATKSPGALRLSLPPSPPDSYHDAQLTDYNPEGEGQWKPPVHMTVTARAEGEVRGTAGFGFWNHPYVPRKPRVRLPQAVWFFFASPPNNMAFATGVPGSGWKAATFNARPWPFLLLAPAAPLGFLLMRSPALYHRLWPIGQRAIGASERLLDPSLLNETHTYEINWLPNRVTFAVNGQTVHEAPVAVGGALGFVAWIDNQYAIVTPQGQFGYGLLSIEQEQALVLSHIAIENLQAANL